MGVVVWVEKLVIIKNEGNTDDLFLAPLFQHQWTVSQIRNCRWTQIHTDAKSICGAWPQPQKAPQLSAIYGLCD